MCRTLCFICKLFLSGSVTWSFTALSRYRRTGSGTCSSTSSILTTTRLHHPQTTLLSKVTLLLQTPLSQLLLPLPLQPQLLPRPRPRPPQCPLQPPHLHPLSTKSPSGHSRASSFTCKLDHVSLLHMYGMPLSSPVISLICSFWFLYCSSLNISISDQRERFFRKFSASDLLTLTYITSICYDSGER